MGCGCSKAADVVEAKTPQARPDTVSSTTLEASSPQPPRYVTVCRGFLPGEVLVSWEAPPTGPEPTGYRVEWRSQRCVWREKISGSNDALDEDVQRAMSGLVLSNDMPQLGTWEGLVIPGDPTCEIPDGDTLTSERVSGSLLRLRVVTPGLPTSFRVSSIFSGQVTKDALMQAAIHATAHGTDVMSEIQSNTFVTSRDLLSKPSAPSPYRPPARASHPFPPIPEISVSHLARGTRGRARIRHQGDESYASPEASGGNITAASPPLPSDSITSGNPSGAGSVSHVGEMACDVRRGRGWDAVACVAQVARWPMGGLRKGLLATVAKGLESGERDVPALLEKAVAELEAIACDPAHPMHREAADIAAAAGGATASTTIPGSASKGPSSSSHQHGDHLSGSHTTQQQQQQQQQQQPRSPIGAANGTAHNNNSNNHGHHPSAAAQAAQAAASGSHDGIPESPQTASAAVAGSTSYPAFKSVHGSGNHNNNNNNSPNNNNNNNSNIHSSVGRNPIARVRAMGHGHLGDPNGSVIAIAGDDDEEEDDHDDHDDGASGKPIHGNGISNYSAGKHGSMARPGGRNGQNGGPLGVSFSSAVPEDPDIPGEDEAATYVSAGNSAAAVDGNRYRAAMSIDQSNAPASSTAASEDITPAYAASLLILVIDRRGISEGIGTIVHTAAVGAIRCSLSRPPNAIALPTPHNSVNIAERNRWIRSGGVVGRGGLVEIDDCTLPVTRCLGLPALKAVSPELLLGTPTITSREVATPPDEGIIIASKGVFGVIGEREAISMLTGDRSASTVSGGLCLRARKLGYTGDVTAVAIRFVPIAGGGENTATVVYDPYGDT